MIARNILLAGLVAALAGCGSDTDATAAARLLPSIAAGLIRPAAAPTGAPVLTRAMFAAQTSPLLMAELPSRKAVAFLAPLGQNGGVQTWSTTDNITISTRDGMLVATRGFGNDLMSVAGPTLGQIARAGGSHARSYFYLDGADQTVRRDFDCTVQGGGAETITVVERSYATRHMVETCTGATGTFTNDYWIEGGSRIRQSRQMLVQELGQLTLSRIVD